MQTISVRVHIVNSLKLYLQCVLVLLLVLMHAVHWNTLEQDQDSDTPCNHPVNSSIMFVFYHKETGKARNESKHALEIGEAYTSECSFTTGEANYRAPLNTLKCCNSLIASVIFVFVDACAMEVACR